MVPGRSSAWNLITQLDRFGFLTEIRQVSEVALEPLAAKTTVLQIASDQALVEGGIDDILGHVVPSFSGAHPIAPNRPAVNAYALLFNYLLD